MEKQLKSRLLRGTMLEIWNNAHICFHGFMKFFLPDSQYFQNILVGSKNFTTSETTQDIYAMTAYINMALTLLALLLTDILRYKLVIVLGAFAGIAFKTILYFGHSLTHMQVMTFFIALFKSSSVAYRTYIYTQVEKSSYQQSTAIINIMPKAGLLISSLTAQALLSLQLATFENLIQMSIAAMWMALLSALLLPPVQKSTNSLNKSKNELQKPTGNGQMLGLLWKEFKVAYTNPYVLKWCVWWVLATGATQLVMDYYVQALWSEVSIDRQSNYNGGVEAVYLTFSVLSAYVIGRVTIDWQRFGDLTLALSTLIRGFVLVASAQSNSLVLSYFLHTVSSVLQDTMTVVTYSQVALQLKNEGFGLIFGINSFLSLIFQSVLTYLLTSKHTLALSIRMQFFSVGWCFVVLGLGYFPNSVVKLVAPRKVLELEKPTVSVVSLETATHNINNGVDHKSCEREKQYP